MSILEIQVPRSWGIKFPAVARYIESRYMEDFFETGSLMLTTYSRCVTHEDEVRRDSKEGQSNHIFLHGNYQTEAVQNVGKCSYMLCTSMLESESLMARFNVDNYIRIHNVLAFADAVSRWVPGFQRGQLGPCIYREQRVITRESKHLSGIDPTAAITAAAAQGTEAVEKAFEEMREKTNAAVSRELAGEPYFLKEDAFAVESEYRIVWTVPYEVTEPLFIKCPEAIQFCAAGRPTDRSKQANPKVSGQSTGFHVTTFRQDGSA